MDLKILLGGAIASILSLLVGKFWGKKQFDKGYNKGAADYIDDIAGKSEIAKAAVDAVERVADDRAAEEIKEAEQYFESVVGRKPTALELKQFEEEAEK